MCDVLLDAGGVSYSIATSAVTTAGPCISDVKAYRLRNLDSGARISFNCHYQPQGYLNTRGQLNTVWRCSFPQCRPKAVIGDLVSTFGQLTAVDMCSQSILHGLAMVRNFHTSHSGCFEVLSETEKIYVLLVFVAIARMP